ncbi:hypothetical protein HO932_05800 [Streptococcus suis]|nr:hypothetical protein [Streptococcus suis]
MEQYFKQFEEKLQITEEKLDILSEWHIAKGHKGATEIAEECRKAVTSLWVEFYKLSEAYKEAEVSHKDYLEDNVKYVLERVAAQDNMEKSINETLKRPRQTLFELLNTISRKTVNINQEASDEQFVYNYLLELVKKDREAVYD